MRRGAGLASVGVITLAVVVGFFWQVGGQETGIPPAVAPTDPSHASPSVVPSRSPSIEPASQRDLTPYERAIDAAAARGLEVWIDVDLAQRWLEGAKIFATTITKLAPLARRPGVVGFKIADELGYQDGFETAGSGSCVPRELGNGASEDRANEEDPRRLLVPELGCAQGMPSIVTTSLMCPQQARARYPAFSLSNVDAYVRSGLIDVVDLSTDLLAESTYASWGITGVQAQRAAWREVTILRWSRYVTIHERHALAHPGSYSGTQAERQSDAHLFASIPLSAGCERHRPCGHGSNLRTGSRCV